MQEEGHALDHPIEAIMCIDQHLSEAIICVDPVLVSYRYVKNIVKNVMHYCPKAFRPHCVASMGQSQSQEKFLKVPLASLKVIEDNKSPLLCISTSPL